MEMHDDATIAGLLALAIGLIKVIEVLVIWGMKKMKSGREGANGHVTLVQLDPSTSQALKEILEKVHDVHQISQVKDQDGIPMMYSSRSNNENVKQIALCLRDVSHCQERIVEKLDKMNDKLETISDNSKIAIKVLGDK
jgi:hypothetical protein